MNREPNNKRPTQRRLNVEMMETRLMLSISPASSLDMQGLVEVELVPPPAEGAHSVDLLDFRDMAEQFNTLLVGQQVNQIVPMPELPEPKESPLDLRDPSEFLGATSVQTTENGPYGTSLSSRLSEESVAINWDSKGLLSQAADFSRSSDHSLLRQEPPSETVRTAETPMTDSGDAAASQVDSGTDLDRIDERDHVITFQNDVTLIRNDPPALHIDSNGSYPTAYARTFDSSRNMVSIDFVVICDSGWENGFVLGAISAGPDVLETDFTHNFLGNGDLMTKLNEHLDTSKIKLDLQFDITPAGEVFVGDELINHEYNGLRGITISYNLLKGHDLDLGFRNTMSTDKNGFSLPEFPSGWDKMPQYVVDLRSALPGQPGGPWDVPPPPTQTPNFRDAFRATASFFYQELFSASNSGTSAELGSVTPNATSAYDSLQNNSFTRQYADEEGEIYEESSLLTLFGGGNGKTSGMETEELALFKNQKISDDENPEMEGLMDTELGEMFVDKNHSDGEGGIIDISIAMNMAQKPVAASPEGIVEASVQQDGKVAFEGLYGQGQTFELANVEEEETFSTPEEPATEDISAALMKALNQMPLGNNSQENLDKTDINPTDHELALDQMSGEMDYAAIFPADTFAWVTFAFVGHHATQHPNDQKKKK